MPDKAWRNEHTDQSTRWTSPASLQMAETLPLLNPPQHARIRRVLGTPFSPAMMAETRPRIDNIVRRLLTDFDGHLRERPADFVTLVSEELPIITIGEWMRIPPSDYVLLRDLTHDQVHSQEVFPTRSDLAVSDAATVQLQKYFTDLIHERRQNLGADPISNWIRAGDEFEADRDTVDAIVHSLALFMILAALETTSVLLANAVRLLAEYPEQQLQVRGDRDLIPDAIEEVLRYDAPVQLITRVAGTDTELEGIPIAAGQNVQLLISAAHHDPAQYTAPHAFDVRRRRRAGGRFAPHLGFGAGVHYCLGSALARMEASSLLTALLDRPPLCLAAPPTWASPRLAFRRMTSLPLRYAPNAG
ncbi:cytochrome P450 [Streptomyces sp. NPDC020707]|uniref:cytochrome P450 n=1 Tax=Streptomyces sp. NPDC020707 TaxID=3365084 RepID=UPI00379C556A